MSSIRKENIKKVKSEIDFWSDEKLIEKLMNGDIGVLAKCITWVESEQGESRSKALRILAQVEEVDRSAFRLGITGVPGVGKSTFIEALGTHLIDSYDKKIAVLAIDPTSQKSQGSILGDKTRMEVLAKNPKAFIRPSATRDSLGGVNHFTKESIRFCEVANFDLVIVETVGVGQSETAVHEMTDFFLLLMLAGAGDELQGIKRGIMEMADAIYINKADGDNVSKSKLAQAEYKAALHLFPPSDSGWIPEVGICSALQQEGMDEIWEMIMRYERLATGNKYWETKRFYQDKKWLKQAYIDHLIDKIHQDQSLKESYTEIERKLDEGKVRVFEALQKLIS